MLITSPCSGILTWPSTVPDGSAMIASYVGPPPRPTEPPRPWKNVSRTPCRRATSRVRRCACWICHCEVAMPPALFEDGQRITDVEERELGHLTSERSGRGAAPAPGRPGRQPAALTGSARPREIQAPSGHDRPGGRA